MSWVVARVTDATAEVLTTTDAKKHLRVEHTDDDAYIGSLSKGWRYYLEERTNHSFAPTTWDYLNDEWPDGSKPIEVPRGPVLSVTSVKYTTTTSTTAQTLAATAYVVDTKSEPGRIALKSGQAWPTNTLRDVNGVEVRYVGGMATSATGVPENVRSTLRLLVGSSYVNREAVIVGSINTKLHLAAEALISTFDARRYL